MLRRRLLTRVGLAFALLSACGGGPRPAAPTTPTAPALTVASLTISRPAGSLKPGDTVQLVATATLTDGSSQIATTSAAWVSSAPELVRITGTGLATAIADGDATVTATYAAQSAAVGLSVRTGGRTLEGRVTESAPTETRVVAGAQVLVAGGLYQGATATTDANGNFSLRDVAGPLQLRISKDRFSR